MLFDKEVVPLYFGFCSLENEQNYQSNQNIGKVTNVTRNNLSYTIHDHVNETIALKIAEILVSVQSVGESDYNSEVLRCHPHVCRCIHVHFVLNYQNGMHRFSSKRTSRISIKKLYFAHLLILIIAFVVSTPI